MIYDAVDGAVLDARQIKLYGPEHAGLVTMEDRNDAVSNIWTDRLAGE